MNSYQVVFLDTVNETHKNIIFAVSKKDLIATLESIDIFDDNIMSINSNVYFGNHYLALEKQMIILIRLSAVMSSDIKPTLYQIASKFKNKHYIVKHLIDNKYDLATILAMLDFSEHIIEIVKTAQKTGQSAASIDLAIASLEQEIDMQKSLGNAILWMKIKLFFVIATIMPMPLYIDDFFASSAKSGFILKTNIISDFLFFINDNYFATGILLFVPFVIFLIFKASIAQRVIYLYPFNVIDAIERCKNTLLLLNLLIPNHQFGVVHIDTIKQYAKVSSKTRIEAELMIEQMNDYQVGLSDAIKVTNLATIFKDGMDNFDQTKDTKTQLKNLQLLRTICLKELTYNNEKLNTIAKTVSAIIIVITIFVLFGGFVLPRMGAGISY